MLSAINRNKVKLELKEDTLTSSIFDLLSYLPQEIFEKLLQGSVYGNSLKEINTGKILEIEFWPHWNSEETENKNFVEPDVFIQFENLDLIVEAKRMDENQQSEEQWKKEIQAYKNEFKEKGKEFFLLAIGGIYKEEERDFENCKVIKCKWTTLLSEVKKVRENNSIDSTIRILDGIILAFQLHGYFTSEWFNEFPNPKNYEINNDSIEFFRNNLIGISRCQIFQKTSLKMP